MKFNTNHTEEFIENYYEELLEAHRYGQINQALIAEMCMDAGVPEWNTDSIWATEVRDYFDEKAEQQYYAAIEEGW